MLLTYRKQQKLIKIQADIVNFVSSLSYLLFWLKDRNHNMLNKDERKEVFGPLNQILDIFKTSTQHKPLLELIAKEQESLGSWVAKIVSMDAINIAQSVTKERDAFQTSYAMFLNKNKVTRKGPQNNAFDKNTADEERKNLAAIANEEPTFESTLAFQNRL